MAVVGRDGLETVRTGETHKTSSPSVMLFDKDGMMIWSAL